MPSYTSDQKLDQLIALVGQVVSREVDPVEPWHLAPVLPIVQPYTGDHDLLTKLDTKVDQIQSDVNVLKSQNTNAVTQQQHGELVRVQEDHETRIRANERSNTQLATYGTIGIIAVGIAEAFVSAYFRAH